MSDLSDSQLTALAQKLEAHIPGIGPLSIQNLERIFGGASRQTFKFDAVREDVTHPLILRRDPGASLIDTERKVEFAAYRAFAGSSVPVPSAVLLEEGTQTLGSAFFIMGRVEGAAGSPFQADCYGAAAPLIAQDCFTHLGTIAAQAFHGTEFAQTVPIPEPETCWSVALDYWEEVIRTDSLEVQPIALAAIRWLRRNPPPPPARLSIVHGDYRSGNFLVGSDGHISAILDWEMAHIGDAHEDLAWVLDPLWSHDPEMPLLGIERANAIALWETTSGLALNPLALKWWAIFSALKGVAIWTSAGKAFASGANMDLVNAWSAWYCTQFHNRQLAKVLNEEVAS